MTLRVQMNDLIHQEDPDRAKTFAAELSANFRANQYPFETMIAKTFANVFVNLFIGWISFNNSIQKVLMSRHLALYAPRKAETLDFTLTRTFHFLFHCDALRWPDNHVYVMSIWEFGLGFIRHSFVIFPPDYMNFFYRKNW